MSVAHLLYYAAGAPSYPADTHGMCRICGEDTHGVQFSAWVRDTFTNHDKLRPGTILCPACQFLFDESSTLLQAQTGRDKPQRMRTYSHLVHDGVWHALHKGQKREMRKL